MQLSSSQKEKKAKKAKGARERRGPALLLHFLLFPTEDWDFLPLVVDSAGDINMKPQMSFVFFIFLFPKGTCFFFFFSERRKLILSAPREDKMEEAPQNQIQWR